jgi:hypothetical protein
MIKYYLQKIYIYDTLTINYNFSRSQLFDLYYSKRENYSCLTYKFLRKTILGINIPTNKSKDLFF